MGTEDKAPEGSGVVRVVEENEEENYDHVSEDEDPDIRVQTVGFVDMAMKELRIRKVTGETEEARCVSDLELLMKIVMNQDCTIALRSDAAITAAKRLLALADPWDHVQRGVGEYGVHRLGGRAREIFAGF